MKYFSFIFPGKEINGFLKYIERTPVITGARQTSSEKN
jgi:hypothetical protein